MKWVNGYCQLSDDLEAHVSGVSGHWSAAVLVRCPNGWVVRKECNFTSEEAAKAAVCHWIGKTMAQFSNALAAGCNEQDDGA